MATVCRVFGISRQSVYQAIKRDNAKRLKLAPVKELVIYWRKYMPQIGTLKLYKLIKPELIERNIKLGRDGLFTYLRLNNLLVKPKKNYTKTTNSKHWMRKHPNLLKEYKATKAEEVFVSDITYLKSDEGTHYLSLTTDAYSRKIMGYEL
ncbi:IS3 family transposase, partial [Pseudoalteromonas sp. S16_S37]|nr:IS3 family transposase [Pseudoalteromonas sp. S16_S37]